VTRRTTPVALLAAAAILAGCGEGDRATSSTSTAATTPATTTTTGGATTTTPATTGDVDRRPFSEQSVWNRRVVGLPVSENSERMIRLAARSWSGDGDDGISESLRRNLTRLFINTRGWAPPVFEVGRGSWVDMTCRQKRCVAGGRAVPDRLRLPDDARSDPGHDGWVVLVDEPNGVVYDLWRARRAGNAMSFQFSRAWRLQGDGHGTIADTDTPRTPSIRGSGLPLLAGLIRPSELRNGRIEHALAIGVPGAAAGRLVAPASTTNGLGPPESLPQGARIRLRADAFARVRRALAKRLDEERRRARRLGVDPSATTAADGDAVVGDGTTLGDGTTVGDGSVGVTTEDGALDALNSAAAGVVRADQDALEAILVALRDYGAIVVERADSPTLYAQSNADYSNLFRGDELGEIRLRDFEVVGLPATRTDPDAPPEAPR